MDTAASAHASESHAAVVISLAIDDLWKEAEAGSLQLGKSELTEILLIIGAKYNYGLPAEFQATAAQINFFWRGLQLKDLALAHACALGHDSAWRVFLSKFREPLTQCAVALTHSLSLGQELADSIYSDMFGLSSRDGQRRSPLSSYAGRGSLLGFLRTVLAQRQVDQYRRTRHETPLDDRDFASTAPSPEPSTDMLERLGRALTLILRSLGAEERFLLSAWFLDQRTLFDIAQVCRVHESTVSRQLKRLTERLRKELLKTLQLSGLSKKAAEEALGTDPRDLRIPIRKALQSSVSATFLKQEPQRDEEPV